MHNENVHAHTYIYIPAGKYGDFSAIWKMTVASCPPLNLDATQNLLIVLFISVHRDFDAWLLRNNYKGTNKPD